jgi:hypothetical protein
MPGRSVYGPTKGAKDALLSDDNRWVNAQRIEVPGGMSL